MRTVNMHEAKTHLSRLVEAAANGEPFIIARAGEPDRQGHRPGSTGVRRPPHGVPRRADLGAGGL